MEMADKNFQTIKLNGNSCKIQSCWESLSLTKEYMLALLSRDEYAPALTKKPSNTETIYIDPISKNEAGVHSGQCVCYPDEEVKDKNGISIVKNVVVDSQGTPIQMSLFDATNMENRVSRLEEKVRNGCYGNGIWYNTLKWLEEAVWDNGN